ncbi:PspC domain-containing protein [Shouchella sp. JSM 1781072]|uniref:PspC domain-containing protein n=1 Tax=Bacillaceae TaxID=186817 RepID=UPI000C083EAD|nr:MULTISPECIES: PspC domain-containing protein [Bacillaceae]UTR05587.1 PspC domain-containing protein [Alkalihalobacillus sp. LMS6]
MKQLKRSSNKRMITGVCGGIAEYFSIDPTIIRLIAVILALISTVWPVLIAYIIATFLMPTE